MPEAPAAPAPVVQEPTKLPAPDPKPEGAAALKDAPGTPAPAADDPFEYELDIKGQKQKVKFADKKQLAAVLQKAVFADQVIKDGAQAKRGAEELIRKLKAVASGDVDALEQLMADPEFKGDTKKLGISIVQRLMEDEQLTPEQREARQIAKERDELKKWKEQQENQEKEKARKESLNKKALEVSKTIIEAMKQYPDIPQTDVTMKNVFWLMALSEQRFGKPLSPSQAMAVYSQNYWNGFLGTFNKMSDEQILGRFGQKDGRKVIERIQKLKLQELKDKTNPANKTPSADTPATKKKHLTEKEYDKHFAGLAGL
jgi:hypothetical protein